MRKEKFPESSDLSLSTSTPLPIFVRTPTRVDCSHLCLHTFCFCAFALWKPSVWNTLSPYLLIPKIFCVQLKYFLAHIQKDFI